MKKAIYLLALALGATGFSAQAQKNTFLVYGNLGYNYQLDDSDNESKSFNLNLGVGYQLDHHWTIGVEGGYGTYRDRLANTTPWRLMDMYNFGPFVRYTKPVNKIFAYWVQAGVQGVGGYVGTSANRTRAARINGTGAYIKPGVSVFFCGPWALNFDLGGIAYSSLKERGAPNRTNNFGFDFGRQVNLGVSVNIGSPSKGKKFRKHRNAEQDQDGYEDWKRRRNSDD